MDCDADIACLLERIAMNLSDPMEGFWPTLWATVVGALIAVTASGVLFEIERRRLMRDREIESEARRVERLNLRVAEIIEGLTAYGSTIPRGGGFTKAEKNTFDRARSRVISMTRAAMLDANDEESNVFLNLITGVGGTPQWDVASAQVQAWAYLLVEWRRGRRSAEDVGALLGSSVQVILSTLPTDQQTN